MGLDDPTLDATPDVSRTLTDRRRGRLVPALSILWHADARRTGEISPLTEPEIAVARTEPDFYPPRDPSRRYPLADPYLSKTPAVHLNRDKAGGIVLAPGAAAEAVEVDARALDGPRTISWEEIEKGVVITIGTRVALCLHSLRPPEPRAPGLGLVGESDAMEQVRATINRLAGADMPVLILGETGTGKELVAQGIHSRGPRPSGPFIPVNMGGLAPATAAAQLFGHEKGSFTGAVAASRGLFGEADGGTIFLDEIGLAPLEIQRMLHRFLEAGEVLPVGATRPRTVKARVIAATDADLERDVEAERFLPALFFRLAGFQLPVPALRERRQDVGQLLEFFLARALARHDALARIHSADARHLWLRPSQVARLALLAWPGNVRDLRNVAERIALLFHDRERVELEEALRSSYGSEATGVTAGSTSSRAADAPASGLRGAPPGALLREEVAAAIRQHGGSIPAAAQALGISKVSLYDLAKRYGIQTARSLADEEIRSAHRELGGNLKRMAERFGISLRALQLRLKDIDLDDDGNGKP